MEELGLALRTMGEKPTVFTMMEMINAVDSDGDGIIDFAEFAAFLTFISVSDLVAGLVLVVPPPPPPPSAAHSFL